MSLVNVISVIDASFNAVSSSSCVETVADVSAANATGAMVSTIITARKADNNLLFMFILLRIIFSGKSGAVSPFLRKICT